jgi:hypothetical protein
VPLFDPARSFVLFVLAAAACGSADPPKTPGAPLAGDAAVDQSLPECEGAIAYLTARTADGRPTIAAVELSPPGACRVDSLCVPAINGDAGTGTPCAEVQIRSNGIADRCTMTFISTDGRSVSTSASVHKVEGTDHQCRNGQATYTAYSVAFDPPMVLVDFGMASTSDGGALDR